MTAPGINLRDFVTVIVDVESDEAATRPTSPSGRLKDPQVRCNSCHHIFSESTSRLKAHFHISGSGVKLCTALPPELSERQRLALSQSTPPKKKDRQTSLFENWDSQSKKFLDLVIANFFYRHGISFNVARSPEFVDMVSALVSYNSKISYTPPSYNSLRTSLLSEVKNVINSRLSTFFRNIRTTGCTVVLDCWKDVRGRSLVNFLFVSPDGAVFEKAVNLHGKSKTALLIEQELSKVIRDRGSDNFTQIVSDRGSEMNGCQRVISKFQAITWTPCYSHTLDLFLEDLDDLDIIADVNEITGKIVSFIKNQEQVNAIFLRLSDGCELLKPTMTRFATNFIQLGRLLKVKQAVRMLLINGDYERWKNRQKTRKKKDHIALFESFITDGRFWDQAKEIHDFCLPFVELLNEVNSDTPVMGSMFRRFTETYKKIFSTELQFLEQYRITIAELFLDRWNIVKNHLHFSAHLLDPKNQDFDPLNEDMQSLRNSVVTTLKKLLSPEDAKAAFKQLCHYRTKKGSFADPLVWEAAVTMEGNEWWDVFGGDTPQLTKVAIKVLSCVVTAAASERCWSVYSYIINRRRNRMTPERQNDLVYVFMNLQLLKKQRSFAVNYYTEDYPQLSNLLSNIVEEEDQECLMREAIDEIVEEMEEEDIVVIEDQDNDLAVSENGSGGEQMVFDPLLEGLEMQF
ncbi:hypothetical protein GEMRC1_004516 [Eukaryota sp. GEM-RC1]